MLRGGYGRHLVVATVRDGGPAEKAGVKTGDRLISIDGNKDFQGMSAEDVCVKQLQGAKFIVFIGFVGKLQAEVRLTAIDHRCGIPIRKQVVRGYIDNPVQVYDQRVFRPDQAALFLAVEAKKQTDEVVSRSHKADPSKHSNMFEIQRPEAQEMLQQALRRIYLPNPGGQARRCDEDAGISFEQRQPQGDNVHTEEEMQLRLDVATTPPVSPLESPRATNAETPNSPRSPSPRHASRPLQRHRLEHPHNGAALEPRNLAPSPPRNSSQRSTMCFCNQEEILTKCIV
jgi:hypothetical protein